MGQRDPRIDAYIARAAPFARPILEHIRALVHEACPDVEETIKWPMPAFMHADGILAGMSAFKQHASFGFWKHTLVMGEGAQRVGMGSYGKMTSLADVPPMKRLMADICKAMKLNAEGVKSARARKTDAPKPAPAAPADLVAALKRNKAAKDSFDAFPPSAQRDYVEWITQAKRDETRHNRLIQAVEWLAQGKRRNWKYENC